MSESPERPIVLVTGAGGFVGRAVIQRIPRQFAPIALSQQAVQVDGGENLATNELLARQTSDPLTVDTVIHLAGSANHGLAVHEPWADLEQTGMLAARMLTRLRARRLIVLSSAAVYAGLAGRVGPDIQHEPRTAYGLSKRYVEGLAAALTHDGLFSSLLVVRLYNAFGPGERPTRLIPRIVQAIRSETPFMLTGSRTSLSDPIHVDEVARVITAAIASSAVGTYDLCGGDARTLEVQIERVSAVIGGASPRIIAKPNPDEIPIQFWSDPRHLSSALSTDDPEGFETGVRRYASAMGWLM